MNKFDLNNRIYQTYVFDDEPEHEENNSTPCIEENDDNNIYISEAKTIVTMLDAGATVSNAVRHAFEKRFSSAAFTDAQREEKIQKIIQCVEQQQEVDARRDITQRLNGNQINLHNLTLLLWDVDVMNTSCNYNIGMDDEYESEAKSIIELLDAGVEFLPALVQVFGHWFGVNLTKSHREGAEQLLQRIENLKMSFGKPSATDTMDPRFSNIPMEEDTKLLRQAPKHLGDRYPACHQQWVWDNIYGESLILIAEDVLHLSHAQLEELLRKNPMIKPDSEITFKKDDHGFIFLNFNFQELSS